MRASRRQNAGWDAAYLQIIGRLERESFHEGIVREGEIFPDFMLPSASGRLVTLSEHLSKGPVVLGFFRGTWCPFCKLMLEALAQAMPRIEAKGATLLALTPETGAQPAALQARHENRFEVLCDVDFGVGLQAGVVYKIPPLYRANLIASNLDLAIRQGNAAWCLPVPAIFLIRPDGMVARRFVDVDFTKWPEPDEIIGALEGPGRWS
ncbi:peroxiredoxin-like family protein [Acidocella sp.]|uniref:peroxiredoxin-like family protein n=1 Tax=Acidocella sp. TaxID=50710 RepID=UPI003CFC5059